ncbi:MAG: hypothetical protein PHF64_00425 [Methanoregula sp.]|nr:hypothetical protein [Methanoregula sp.]
MPSVPSPAPIIRFEIALTDSLFKSPRTNSPRIRASIALVCASANGMAFDRSASSIDIGAALSVCPM